MLKFLGVIEIPAGQSKNNTTTATKFTVPSTVAAIRFRQSGAGLFVEVKKDAVDPSSFATTAARGCPLLDPANLPPGMLGVEPLPLVVGGDANVVAVYNDTAGALTLQVWAAMPSGK